MGLSHTYLLILLFVCSGFSHSQELAPSEKTIRYHRLLQKKPGNVTLFSRFVESWLDTDSKENLQKWVEQSTATGKTANWQILASLHDYLGNDQSALTALNEAIKAAPKNTSLRLTRAKLKARLLDFESALLDLQPALDDPRLGIEASKLRSIYLARSGRIKEALTAWQNLVKKHPLDEELREDLIEAQVAEGPTKEAAKTAAKLVAMTRDPYQKALRQLRLGDLQIKSGDREPGLKTYTTLITATAADTWLEREVLAQIERVFLREDDLTGLLAFLENLQKKHPRRVSIRKALARQLAATGKTDKAISLFREILKITPGDLGNREEFITFLEASEKWQLAREELNHLIKQNPNDPSLWQNLLRLETTLKNQSGIVKALTEIRKLRATTPDGLITVANLFQQAKLTQETEKLLREGKEKFPASDEIIEALAAHLITHNRQAEALALWQKLANGAPRESLLRIARSMSSHDKNEEAFNLLLARLSDFQNDPLYLGQICNLATSPATQTRAIPLGKTLIELATTATDLENAIRLTQGLIIQSKQVEQALALDPKTRGQKCLHASLAAHLGDFPRALKFLDEAEALDPTQLTQFFRIRFEEKFGTINRAIDLLRSLIATPAGRKTVHLRRLVNLLEQNGDWPAALAAVIEWKKIAPGDQAAWKRKADLHLKLNEPEKAVTELRRLIGRFDATPDHQILLAEALLENDEPRPARQIYQRLYQDSDDLKSKLKWLTPLVRIANQNDHLPELLADFERRKRNNPTSVAPLLALAEIHRLNRNDEQRRSALLEAIRRRPNDLPLLLGIATEEERFGEVSRAISILREALKNDSGHLIKRRLAMLHLRLGEIQTGLRLLNEIPGEKNNPRQIETTVIALIASRDLTAAREHLQSHLAQHRDDWRLRYLQGILCDFEQDFQKSITLFSELQKANRQLPNLTPLLGPHIHQSQNQASIPLPGTPPGWQDLGFLHNLIKEDHSKLIDVLQGKPHHGSLATLIRLPGSPREARLMATLAIAKTARTLDRNSPIRQATLEQLTLPDIPAFPLFKSQHLTRKNQLTVLETEIKKHPDSLFHLRLWLRVRCDETPDLEEKEIHNAFLKIARLHPQAASELLYEMGNDRDLHSSQIPPILNLILQNTPQNDLPKLLTYLDQIDHLLEYQPESVHIKISAHLLAQLPRLNEARQGLSWLPRLLAQSIRNKNTPDSIKLINLLKQHPQRNSPILAWSHLSGVLPPGGESMIFIPPSFPPLDFPDLFYPLGSFLDDQFNFKLTQEERKRLKTLAQLSPGKTTERTTGPLEFLRGHEDKIADPYFRDLLTASLSKEKALPEIAAKFASAENQNHLGKLLFAAGYYFEKGEIKKSYHLLLRAHRLPLSSALRERITGSLVHLGAVLKARGTPDFDPDPAIKATLSLRRKLSGDELAHLSRHLVALGAEKPEPPKSSFSRTLRKSPSRAPKNKPISQLSGLDGVMAHLILNDREAALREATKFLLGELRANDYFISGKITAQLRSLGLAKDILPRVAPPKNAPHSRRLEHARLALQLDQPDAARKIFRDLLNEKPDDAKVRAHLLMLTPPTAWKPKEIDDTTLEELASFETDNLETLLKICDLVTNHLEKLSPDKIEDRNLWWAMQFLRERSKQTEFGLTRITVMSHAPLSDHLADPEAEARRNEAFLSLIHAMLRHPDLSTRAFSTLLECRKSFPISDRELNKIARAAFLNLAKTTFPEDTYSFLTHLLHDQDITDHLLERNDHEFLFAEETLAALRQGHPHDAATLSVLRDLTKGSREEALATYRKWTGNLPEGPEFQFPELQKLIHLIFHLQPPPRPWIADFQSRILSVSEDEAFRSTRILVQWSAYLGATRERQELLDFFTKVFEIHLGDSEKWPLYSEIPSYWLPNELENNLLACSTISRRLVAILDEKSALETALFLSRSGLARPLKTALQNSIDGLSEIEDLLWRHVEGSPEEMAAAIRRMGILQNDPADLSHRALLVMQANFSPDDSDKDWKGSLRKLIELQKGNHPALEALLLAQLLPDKEAAQLLSTVFHNHQDLMRTCREESLETFEEFLREHRDEEGSPVNVVLSEIKKEREQEVRKRITPWLTNGIPLGEPRTGGTVIWRELALLSDFDPKLAAQLAEKTFLKLKTWPKAREFSINPSQQPPVFEDWMQSFFEYFVKATDTGLLPHRIIAADKVIRGPTMDFLDLPFLVARGRSLTHSNYFMERLGNDHKLLVQDFQLWASELTTEQEVTLMGILCAHIVFREISESVPCFEIIELVETELRTTSPVFADGLITSILSQGFPTLDDSEKKKAFALLQKSRTALVARLTDFPLATRLYFLANLSNHNSVPGSFFEDEEFAKTTLADLQDYLASPRRHSPLILRFIVSGLSRADSARQLKFATELITLVENHPNIELDDYLKSFLIRPALSAKRHDLVKKWILADFHGYQSYATLMLDLTAAGLDNLAKQLIAPTATDYETSWRATFKKDWPEKLSRLLPLVPKDHRLALEVALSKCPDAPGKNAPLVDRTTRLTELAKRAITQLPKDLRERLRLLTLLSEVTPAAEVLHEAMEVEIAHLDLEMMWIINAEGKIPGINDELFTLATRTILLDLAAGKTARSLQHFASLANSPRYHGSIRTEIARVEFFENAKPIILARAAGGEAPEMANFARKLLDLTFKFDPVDQDLLLKSLDLIRATHSEEDWKKHLQNLPPKKQRWFQKEGP